MGIMSERPTRCNTAKAEAPLPVMKPPAAHGGRSGSYHGPGDGKRPKGPWLTEVDDGSRAGAVGTG
ncbi:hypothetical protein GCM10012278_26310 [Nonomuraea glycinis]|uniref:Uncharacterized protein n=1 Tax=Nonomuraea glycinis TaxID=2047744 RepID=A0A918A312_9ACTN|nr:hypothetical protein GCM10012278_26310 [Nonomuraea glycinis]